MRYALAMLCVTGVGLTGCGPNADLVPVQGTVTLDGKPMNGGSVHFIAETGRPGTGEIASDGQYSLKSPDGSDGVVAGLFMVIVVAREERQPALGEQREPLDTLEGNSVIPMKYSSTATSGLTCEVRSGTINVFDIQLVSDAAPDGR